MTTIVYDHKRKQIAIDSRATSNGLIASDECEKWKLADSGEMWFTCGTVCDEDLLIECFKDGDRAFDLKVIPDANGFVVRGDKVLMRGVTQEGEAWTQVLTSSRCLGSGSSFGLAALDFGKTAKEAVEYAATRDCYTGGKVHVYDIASAKFVE